MPHRSFPRPLLHGMRCQAEAARDCKQEVAVLRVESQDGQRHGQSSVDVDRDRPAGMSRHAGRRGRAPPRHGGRRTGSSARFSSRSARRSCSCQRCPTPGRRRPAARSVVEHLVGPLRCLRGWRRVVDETHGPRDDGPVELAEGEYAAGQSAHRHGSRRRDRARHERGRRQRTVIDGRDHASAQEIGLGRRWAVTSPQAKHHLWKGFAADRLIQGDSAHKDAFGSRGRDRRGPRRRVGRPCRRLRPDAPWLVCLGRSSLIAPTDRCARCPTHPVSPRGCCAWARRGQSAGATRRHHESGLPTRRHSRR